MPSWAMRPIVVAVLMAGAGLSLWLVNRGAQHEAAFWFEDVEYSSPRLGGDLSSADIEGIASIARAEIAQAFRGLPLTLSDRREARFRVRVVQELHDVRMGRALAVPAEARSVTGFGGQGAVNFAWLASAAIGYAPEDADRRSVIDAIGRGVGRAAVHEFVHLFLPTAPIHDSTDVRSYEYASAARREQYFGAMHWDLAWPLLQDRFRATGTDRGE